MSKRCVWVVTTNLFDIEVDRVFSNEEAAIAYAGRKSGNPEDYVIRMDVFDDESEAETCAGGGY